MVQGLGFRVQWFRVLGDLCLEVKLMSNRNYKTIY